MRYRPITVLLTVCLILSMLSGCSAQDASASSPSQDQSSRLKVVATVFPEYDWVREIAGDRIDLTLLLDKGVDLHSYQPTADDMIKVSTCDLFIYVGGTSDKWVNDALKESTNRNQISLDLMEALGDAVKEEEIVEGMETEQEEELEEEGPEYDEHVWLSLKNAKILCNAITDKLCELDGSNADYYRANCSAYTDRLDDLDRRYQEAVDNADFHTLLFGDRFPFRYLTDDYGLSYYAAFVGCSAETEASFETIIFLAKKTDELGLHAILHIESSDGSIAKTIRNATQSKDQEILTMNSLQSASAKDEDDLTYLAVMESNLEVLKKALKQGE